MLREMEVPNRKAPQRWAKPNSIVNAHSHTRFNHDISCSAVQISTLLLAIKIYFASHVLLTISACDRPPEGLSVLRVHVPLRSSQTRSPTSNHHRDNFYDYTSYHIPGIAFRSRQNGRRNQSPQRQNPGQPGRGLLLLNPLVFTR